MARNYRSQTKETFNQMLAEEGRNFRLISHEGDFLRVDRNATFECENGHTWQATPHCVRRGAGCRKCAGCAPLTREEINEDLAPRGIELISEYVNIISAGTFRGSCGHPDWEAPVGRVRQGSGCPRCSGRHRTQEIVNQMLAPRGIELMEPYKRAKDFHKFRGSCGHEWEAMADNVIRAGSGCSVCVGYGKTRESINQELAPRGIILLSDYIKGKAPAKFRCKCGHEWPSNVTNVLTKGRGCPKCAKFGILGTETCYVYVMLYGNGLCKIGASNEPLRRRSQLKKATRETIELVACYQFEDGTGRAAVDAEQRAHRHFEHRHAAQTGFDGSSELFAVSPAEACEYLRGIGGRVAEPEA